MSARHPLSSDEQKSAFIGFAVLLVIVAIVVALAYSYAAMLSREEVEAWSLDQRIGSCESDRCQREYRAAAAQREAREVTGPGTTKSSCSTDWNEDGEPYRLCPDAGGGDVSEGYTELHQDAEEPVWRK